VLGGGLYPGCLHVKSAWNRADVPSRDRDVEPACAETAPWIKALQHGDVAPFEMMLQAAKWARPVGRWVRLLLLISGDVERNPGPLPRWIFLAGFRAPQVRGCRVASPSSIPGLVLGCH
jgi:hypothetical protein